MKIRKIIQQGFTLLELLIVILIIGILSNISVLGYQSYMYSARTGDGKSDVYQVLAQQERYFMNNMTYTLNLGDGGLGYNLTGGGLESIDGYYLTTARTCPSEPITTCVSIGATGQGSQAPSLFWMQSDGVKGGIDKDGNVIAGW